MVWYVWLLAVRKLVDLQTKWLDLHYPLRRRKRVVEHILGDGMFFLKLVLFCLQFDHGVSIKFEEALQIITEHMIEYHDKYSEFHIGQEEGQVTRSDLLIGKALDFFKDRNYQWNIVDLLIQITADSLGLDIFIFMNVDGHIKIIKQGGGSACKLIYLKYEGEHYDAVIKNIDMKVETEIINLINDDEPEPASESTDVDFGPDSQLSATTSTSRTSSPTPSESTIICETDEDFKRGQGKSFPTTSFNNMAVHKLWTDVHLV